MKKNFSNWWPILVCGIQPKEHVKEYLSWGQRFLNDFQERLKTDMEEIKTRKMLYENSALYTFDLYNYHTVDEIHEYINQVKLNLDTVRLTHS